MSSNNESELRFDGIYQSSKLETMDQHPYYQYLRFYQDGTVINASTEGEPFEICKWFYRNYKEIGKGTYSINNHNLKFTCSTTFHDLYGVAHGPIIVDYEGTIVPDKLLLNSYSHHTKNRSNMTYHFIEIKELI